MSRCGVKCRLLPYRMSAAEPKPPVYYNSCYRPVVDDKRRVQIPAKWRSGGDESFTLILWPSGGRQAGHLLVLPPEPMAALVAKLKAMPYSDPTTETLRRLLGKNSDQVVVDKGGRICLPEAMAKAVGIQDTAVLQGLFDRFEIWSPERYDETSAVDEAFSSKAFALI